MKTHNDTEALLKLVAQDNSLADAVAKARATGEIIPFLSLRMEAADLVARIYRSCGEKLVLMMDIHEDRMGAPTVSDEDFAAFKRHAVTAAAEYFPGAVVPEKSGCVIVVENTVSLSSPQDGRRARRAA